MELRTLWLGLVLTITLLMLDGEFNVTLAAFYKYYDESGGVNVTNDYKSIPERYRANVITVTDKELDGRSKASERQQRPEKAKSTQNQGSQTQRTAPQPDTAPPASTASEKPDTQSTPANPSNNWLSRQLPFLKIVGMIVLLIAGAIIAGKFVSALAPRPLAIVIKVAIFAALTVYIFKGLSGKVVEAFNNISEESKSVQKAVDKRGEDLKLRVDKE